jgi:hypothetical protein
MFDILITPTNEVVRYGKADLNPVRAGMVAHAGLDPLYMCRIRNISVKEFYSPMSLQTYLD